MEKYSCIVKLLSTKPLSNNLYDSGIDIKAEPQESDAIVAAVSSNRGTKSKLLLNKLNVNGSDVEPEPQQNDVNNSSTAVPTSNVKNKNRHHHVQHCAAINCKKNRYDNPDLSFFRFPKDEERCRIWVRNTGREDICQKTAAQLNSGSVLCSDHFESTQFTSTAKTRLKSMKAVPTLFDVPGRSCPETLAPSAAEQRPMETCNTLTDQNLSGDSDFPKSTVTPSSTVTVTTSTVATNTVKLKYVDTDKIKLLKRKLDCQRKIIKRLHLRMNNTKAFKNERKEIKVIKDMSSKYLNKDAHDFFCTQLDLSITKGNRWSSRDKNFALSLYHASPEAYKMLQNLFYLPSVDTLKRLTRSIDIPRISTQDAC